jgi:glycosyltransferase involved in cell wall biosynthesis
MQADLFHLIDHSYGHVAPVLRGPVVVTVHDLQPLMVLAQRTGSLRTLVRNRFLRRSMEGLKAAAAVIVSTSWMASRVAGWVGDRIPVHVVPYGIDLDFANPRDDDERSGIREGYGIPPGAAMLLHVGSTDERKGLPRLMETIALLRDRNREVRLVQVGGDVATIRELAAGHGVGDLVIAAGSVTEKQLRDGYFAADVFVFPSTYEGFGLPILEAMACGLPVVYSGAAATREVAGEAALLVEGDDAEAYAGAIVAVLDDEDGVRRGMADAGRERASQFTWERCARETIAVYREVLER